MVTYVKWQQPLGHTAGDQFLKTLSKRISQVLHNEELLHTGGDEFVIIIPELSTNNHSCVLELTRKILTSLQQPVAVNGYEFIVTGSIGISIYPNDTADANDLVKFAESAMFQAKKNGRNNYQWHNKRFTLQNFKYIQYESALRKAIKQQHLSTYLQPQTDLKSGRIIGAETLLRIHQGTLADISPAEYIPVAEESGLVVDIGEWVFRAVCQQVSSWHQQHRIPDEFHAIAVNISPIEFNRPDFIEKISQTLLETGAPAQFIELELTESALQFPSDELYDKLTTLKELGLSVAIDDFGTGYSSLSRLKNLPIDVLKIDRSFIHDIHITGSNNQAIVEAVINMAKALNIKTLAEGIENEAQVKQLQLLNCQYGQGYWFGKPVPVEQFASSTLLETSLTAQFNS
ncbi:putative bifunctional diguanylate cyclase/phosphodiesterase [methane-oxidizing endosymbiont of Gigantopelta aegis]|uniref:putative bifunctional diguanylate cyclase/phosphodiesterase n=1 Tax=methane-oxidizing endosymbiont of Gigantopelta aegis TaxID=2794938 RepID=UPI0018DE0AC1|nr:GGDEF domain-containing phosphodiesterase [methane-oxidizing endosymbiont of Gigantopelta aegis]